MAAPSMNVETTGKAYKEATSGRWLAEWTIAYKHLDDVQVTAIQNILRGFDVQWDEEANADPGHTDLTASAQYSAPTSEALSAFESKIIALQQALVLVPLWAIWGQVRALAGGQSLNPVLKQGLQP